MELTQNAAFLLFVKVLVNETTRDEPMTKEQIFSRCLEEGYCPSSHAFYQYMKDLRRRGSLSARSQWTANSAAPCCTGTTTAGSEKRGGIL